VGKAELPATIDLKPYLSNPSEDIVHIWVRQNRTWLDYDENEQPTAASLALAGRYQGIKESEAEMTERLSIDIAAKTVTLKAPIVETGKQFDADLKFTVIKNLINDNQLGPFPKFGTSFQYVDIYMKVLVHDCVGETVTMTARTFTF